VLPYRPAAGVALFGPDGRVFVGRRARGQTGTWQMPQGGIDDGESPLEGALRELGEETGVTDVAVIAELPEWLTYDLPDDLEPKPKWAARFRGQRQRWFAMRLLGGDDSISIGSESPEFDAWRWVALDETPALVVPFKRAVYERVAEAFAPYAVRAQDPPASGRLSPGRDSEARP
jgi:putative (di)nucleoside polyphosphate hydrolase